MTATRDVARRARGAREGREGEDEALRARLVEIETVFARERESRTAEATLGHERRRIRAIERLLERTARRDEPSARRAALVAADANCNCELRNRHATSAEEELVAIEGEHARELERLRATAAAKAETARGRPPQASTRSPGKRDERARRRVGERTLVPRDRRIELDAGPKGISVALRALKALDLIEARAGRRTESRRARWTWRPRFATLSKTSRQRRDAAGDRRDRARVEELVVSRDVLSETWHTVGRRAGLTARPRRPRPWAREGTRGDQEAPPAGQRVTALVGESLSVTDTYPEEKENDADVVDAIDDTAFAGPRRQKRGSLRVRRPRHAAPLDAGPMSTSLRALGRGATARGRGPAGLNAPPASWSRFHRGRSPVWSPGSPSADKKRTREHAKRRSASPPRADSGHCVRRTVSVTRPEPSPARSPARGRRRSRARSSGARRRVTFGEVTAARPRRASRIGAGLGRAGTGPRREHANRLRVGATSAARRIGDVRDGEKKALARAPPSPPRRLPRRRARRATRGRARRRGRGTPSRGHSARTHALETYASVCKKRAFVRTKPRGARARARSPEPGVPPGASAPARRAARALRDAESRGVPPGAYRTRPARRGDRVAAPAKHVAAHPGSQRHRDGRPEDAGREHQARVRDV